MISQLKGKKQVVFCDIDNSFYDVESAMVSIHHDYPINSESYDLDGKFLAEFYNPQLYQLEFVNKEVLAFLRTKVDEGYQIVFYSNSVSAEIYLRKLWLVQELFGSVPLIPVVQDADILALPFIFENDGSYLEDVIYIDDKPLRIDYALSSGFKVVGVEHPYNKKELEGKRTLTPNYLLEKYNSNDLNGEVKEVEDEQ
jgi:hypothetical protein